jgi:hypothetical protein
MLDEDLGRENNPNESKVHLERSYERIKLAECLIPFNSECYTYIYKD